MKYVLRLLSFFVIGAVVWGMLFGLWLGLHIGMGSGILHGLEGGLMVSLIITGLGALYDFLFRRRTFKKYGKKSFDLVQMREMFYSGHIKNIFQQSLVALRKIPRIRKVCPDVEANKITAFTSNSWLTFGEKIEVRINQDRDRIKVQISSKPRLRTAIFDCGKNIELVEMFSSLLKSEAI